MRLWVVFLVVLGVAWGSCGTEEELVPDKRGVNMFDGSASLLSNGEIVSWVLGQCSCDFETLEAVDDPGLSEPGEYNRVFGSPYRLKVECDSLWGIPRADVQFLVFNSVVLGVSIEPVGQYLSGWNFPESGDSRVQTLPPLEVGMHRLLFDSRDSYDSNIRIDLFSLLIKEQRWLGVVKRVALSVSDTGTAVHIVPGASYLPYVQLDLRKDLDTIWGSYYHWNGYRYVARKGAHYCWNGLYERVDDSVAIQGNWLYRVKFPPYFDHFLLNDEKNDVDTSCADVEQVRVIGWVGEGLWQPHGPDNIPTLYVVDAEVQSVGMPDRFRD